ncbi:MAG: peptide chain release factor N(5)-glutamine methyltransferase [Rhodoferax sp.]
MPEPGADAPPCSLAQSLTQLCQCGLTRLDAQMLLLLALGRPPHDRAWLLAHDGDTLERAASVRLAALTQRRQAGEPMAYLRGEQEFYGLALRVDARALVPRPETETLVAWALELLPPAARVVDLGTGTGAIALALCATRPDLQVHAVERSGATLALAQENAERLALPVQWHQGNWFEALGPKAAAFDAIVSNPPYVAAADPHLAALAHEPLAALASGADGLDDLRHIVSQAGAHLKSAGWLLLEHGFEQGHAVRKALQEAGFGAIQTRCDLAGLERCSAAQWPAAVQGLGDAPDQTMK